MLPAFNEEHRIGTALQQLIEYRAACPHDLEVILVDDGSTDATAAVAQSYMDELPELTIIRLPANRGKGRAVATGMLAASGEYRAFFDADAATPIYEVDNLLAAMADRPRSVAIGSVRVDRSRVVRHQPLIRSLAGRAGNAFIRAAVLPGIADSQRGCKVFPAELADVVFAAQQTDRWGFDIEILALCQALGYKVIEVAVEWTHVEGGQLGADAYLSTLVEVVRIRRLMRTNAHQIEPVRSPQRGFGRLRIPERKAV